MNRIEHMKELLSDLRELSYETGYIAGKIEAGVKEDAIGRKYQEDKRRSKSHVTWRYLHLKQDNLAILAYNL